ncbi:MAG: nucleotidyltransferase family protein [Planctomycetes bacterium]|nr:nucleotidyltransferase family protein [Planctomycetota bacterium]
MAMDRIEQRLHRVTTALDAAQIPYAVVGGNAVAVWVAKADPAATRTTKDVDLLVSRLDVDRITSVMQQLGFIREDLRSLVLFIDPEEPARRSGVHLVWADEKVRPSYLHPTPGVDEAVRDEAGFLVLDLQALIRMKLTSHRDIDRVHISDLLAVGMVDDQIRDSLPTDLLQRLTDIEQSRDTTLDD